ncbi:hypothetical protein KO537_11565 [Shewanella sp. NKUCC01_JLK]|uniref:hypothetical protein n=1 Tax=Shewanella sp. NKUCC01_JLK TaxID=2842123 RepID=UPI001C5B3886|nr:hypothetical protein [Shewanella sp. NKUCC01_JLK]MBW3515362.1 hypothetical protein [Shewanella sp. NKUCC01_JLK]
MENKNNPPQPKPNDQRQPGTESRTPVFDRSDKASNNPNTILQSATTPPMPPAKR